MHPQDVVPLARGMFLLLTLHFKSHCAFCEGTGLEHLNIVFLLLSRLQEHKFNKIANAKTMGDISTQRVTGSYSNLLHLPLPQGKSWNDAAYISATLFYNAKEDTTEDYLPGWEHNPWNLLTKSSKKKKKIDPDLLTWDQAMLGLH